MLPIEIIENIGSFCDDDVTQFNLSATDKYALDNYHYYSISVISMSRLKERKKCDQERFSRAKLRPGKIVRVNHLENTLDFLRCAGYSDIGNPLNRSSNL